MVRLFQFLIRGYAYIVSPFLGRSCRFHPTCSSYAHQALEQHGVLKGMILIIRRIFSCHPWSKKNYDDPVPKRFAWRDILGYKRCSLNTKSDQKITLKNTLDDQN